MKIIETIKIASFTTGENEVFENFIKENQEPTYRDNELNEDLYSIDMAINLKEGVDIGEVPREIIDTLYQITEIDSDICYYRFTT